MTNSPFKFLDAYEKEDIDFFFGREEETKELYEMTYDTRLILLYGASGTGKTSIVQCGLANKFKETRWKEIFVRREQNINESITNVLSKEIQTANAYALGKPETEIEKIELLYKALFKPIYLIFDQFEELFIIDENEEEQNQFFQFIKELLSARVVVKIILIMREEFIAQLSNFEKVIPSLFDYRYRIEEMRYSTAKETINKTLEKLVNQQKIKLEASEEFAENLLTKLTNNKRKLELTYLQVYLDRLYQNGLKLSDSQIPIFNTQLIEQTGSFEDIIGQFLKEQILQIEAHLAPENEGIPIKILGKMITDEHTKRVLKEADLKIIQEQLGINKADFDWCIKAFENMRILKRKD